MYSLEVTTHFASAHHLREYKGKCENLHGHNWRVTARVSAPEPGPEGMVIDFGDLKRMLAAVLAGLDHSYINEHPYFKVVNPTSEHLARWIFDQLAAPVKACNPAAFVSRVAVEEAPGSLAIYEP